MKQAKHVLVPRCVSFTQSDTAKRTPASRVRVSAEFWRGLQEFRQVRFLLTVLLTVCALFLHNSLMPKHREWWLGAELNAITFHKPLEINRLNHHRCLDTKGFAALCQG
jgi:hypothetical protein